MQRTTQYRPVIGLEVHAQLSTLSKMFCGCDARYFDASPNSHVCAVCAGMPGSLPAANERAIAFGLKTALALHCTVPGYSKFDRKNYPYPDIPKGYQISQYDQPIGTDGRLDYEVSGTSRRCRITRVHLEEDTGKTLHTRRDGRELSLVDYNRSGVPLLEIVTEPDIHSAEEAAAFFASLRQILMFLEVCDGKLQEGSMRADVNVSVTGPGESLGTKVEIKNLNSFRSVHRALEYEIGRQVAVLRDGGSIVQETRGWNEDSETTVSQRTKEYAHDYRYFPEPDLPPLAFEDGQLNDLRAELPELPLGRRDRLQKQYGLAPSVASVLVEERALADFYEAAVALADGHPEAVANWVRGDFLRLVNETGTPLDAVPMGPDALASIVSMVESGRINGPSAKRALEYSFESGSDPEQFVERENLSQIVDSGAIAELVESVLLRTPSMIEDYRRGKTNVLTAVVGQVMKASRGRVNPEIARRIALERLGAEA